MGILVLDFFFFVTHARVQGYKERMSKIKVKQYVAKTLNSLP